MDAAYREKWKQWRVESDKGILEGQKAWDAKWTALKDKKVRWFENISKDISEEDMKTRLAEITDTANSFTADVNARYGNIITNEDVNAVLSDIMKDAPSLLSQDMLDRIKEEDMKFAITTFSDLKADTVLYGTFSELMNKYENDIQKTRNLKLIDALTKLLQTLADRILEADEDARNTADNYAAGEGYSREGDQYTSRELLTQQVAAYKQFNFTRSLLIPDADMNKAVTEIDDLPDWQYESMLGILMKQAKINFEGVMDKNVANSLPAHIGNFAQIGASSNFFVGLMGMNDVSGGSGEYGRLSTQIGNQRNGNNAIMGSIKLVKTVASIFTGYGAIALSVAEMGSSVASGEMSFDEAGVEGGKSALKGVLSGLAGTLLKNVPYVGPILGPVVSAGINIGIGGIKYSSKGGFDYRVTAQDAIMGGIALAGDLINIGVDSMTGGDNPTASQFDMRSATKFGTTFMMNTLAGGIKFDASGNPIGYGFSGLNVIDGLSAATSGLISGYASNASQNDYASKYAVASGSKFLSGLLKGALYEGYDALTGSNSTAGMGLKNLAYSLDDTLNFAGSYYGSKLGAAAKKRADDNAKKSGITLGAATRPEDMEFADDPVLPKDDLIIPQDKDGDIVDKYIDMKEIARAITDRQMREIFGTTEVYSQNDEVGTKAYTSDEVAAAALAKNIEDAFLNDTAEQTDAKLKQLEDLKYDITSLKSRIQAYRIQAAQYQNALIQAAILNNATQTNNISIPSMMLSNADSNYAMVKFITDKLKGLFGGGEQSGNNIIPSDARQNLIDAQDAVRNHPIYQPGAGGNFNRPGHPWCNQSSMDIIEATGAGLTNFIGDANRWLTDPYQMEAALIKSAAAEKILEITDPRKAQQFGNQGYTVVVIGNGHVSTIRPNDNNLSLLPTVSNVGLENGIKNINVFAAPVRYFYNPNQSFKYDRTRLHNSWGYPK